jgi:peptide-methionine (R)-S-oxide reductase
MYERFTDRSRNVMNLANREAQRLKNEFVGTEHILLAIVKEGSGVAANVLKNLDVDFDRIRLEVEKIVQPEFDLAPRGRLPQTPRAKRAIEYAIEEARGLKHNYVGTEHLLLGLLREQDGVAGEVLINLGLQLETVRQEVLKFVGPAEERTRQMNKTFGWVKVALLVLAGVCLSYWYLASERSIAQGGNVKVKVFDRKGKLVGPIETAKIVKTDAQWKQQLTPDQYKIARAKGTEAPFCGTLLDNKKEGVYACVCCKLPLFASNSKFNSGTGWPSFFQPISSENVTNVTDRTHGMARTEILCSRCDCHLGHVFDDGPAPTRLRYCVNSESLIFVDEADLAKLADAAAEPPKK